MVVPRPMVRGTAPAAPIAEAQPPAPRSVREDRRDDSRRDDNRRDDNRRDDNPRGGGPSRISDRTMAR